jgi:hypothetical protein
MPPYRAAARATAQHARVTTRRRNSAPGHPPALSPGVRLDAATAHYDRDRTRSDLPTRGSCDLASRLRSASRLCGQAVSQAAA